MIQNFSERVSDYFTLFMQWALETGAFVLLPLFVYLLVYFSIEVDLGKLYKLPEWMFIAVILHADTMRKLLLLYREYKGYALKLIRTLSIGLLGIVICSIFLVLSLLAQEKPNFVLPSTFYHLQMLMFAFALYLSAGCSIWIAYQNQDAQLLKRMILESDEGPYDPSLTVDDTWKYM